MQRMAILGLGLGAVAACGQAPAGDGAGAAADPGAGKPAMALTSTAFAPGAAIPRTHTCEGEDVSPPLAWSGAPAGTQSFALIVDDPDAPDPAAPKTTHVHWVLANLPAAVTSLPAGASMTPPTGAANGTNDDAHAAWDGPCPPIGRHRYFFKLYALDAPALGAPGITKPALLAAIAGHVLARGELLGTYQK